MPTNDSGSVWQAMGIMLMRGKRTTKKKVSPTNREILARLGINDWQKSKIEEITQLAKDKKLREERSRLVNSKKYKAALKKKQDRQKYYDEQGDSSW